MDLSEESDSSLYNSDEIDSDTEVRLYGAIHHTMASEDQQLVTDSGIDSTESHSQSKPIESEDNCSTKAINSETKTSSAKPLNNLFKLLDSKLDESDEEFYEDFDFDFSNNVSKNVSQNKRKIDVIDIDDSSDSDVVIIDDKNSFVAKTKPKTKTKTDICFGNVENLNKSSLQIMNEFYDEDNYNSEEEAQTYHRMSGDKNMWKISQNDILLTHNKNNRYYRNRFICHNCNERGHQARDCPLPKKSPICFLCGVSGHRSDRCRSILCSRCLNSSHKTINCKVSVNQLICDECGVGGHETNECTYNWRKYHLTTTSSSSEPMIFNLRPNVRKCCYNCGAIGKHFGFECRSKSMEKHMIPMSVLMPNTSKSHCFNGRQRNNRRNDWPEKDEKAVYNEFVKSISGNELSRLSASFNKPLDRLDLAEAMPSTSAANTSSKQKNKHIKWIYPETNGTTHSSASSYSSALNDSTPFTRNCQKNRVIAEPTHHTILYAESTALDSAHTLTPTQTQQQINNSMQEKSQTQTTPQLNERSKRRKNKRKKRKIVETEGEDREQQSFKQPNGSNFKPFQHFRRIKTNIKRFKGKNKLL